MAPSHEPWHRPRTKTSPYNLTSRNFHYFLHQIHMVIQFTKKIKYLKNKLRTKHNHHFYKIQTCKTYIIASLDFICTMGKWELVDSTESGLYELPAQLTNSTGVHTEVKADKNGHGTDLVFSLQFFYFWRHMPGSDNDMVQSCGFRTGSDLIWCEHQIWPWC